MGLTRNTVPTPADKGGSTPSLMMTVLFWLWSLGSQVWHNETAATLPVSPRDVKGPRSREEVFSLDLRRASDHSHLHPHVVFVSGSSLLRC